VLVCRVYLSGQSKLHDASAKSVRRASNLSVNRPGPAGAPTAGANATAAVPPGVRKGSSTADQAAGDESVHPGPIFLSHVVSRKFPYRWLIQGWAFDKRSSRVSRRRC